MPVGQIRREYPGAFSVLFNQVAYEKRIQPFVPYGWFKIICHQPTNEAVFGK